MKIVNDRESAMRLAARFEPFFHTHIAGRQLEKIETPDSLQYVIGRKYRGLFDANDGAYVTLTQARGGDTLIDRDSYGAIPLFYSTVRPIVSTDIRLLIEIEKPGLNFQALGEYLSASYLTGGNTIYENVRALMPNETLVATENSIEVRAKNIFPDQATMADADAAHLLELAIDNSVNDLLERYPGPLVLNLSGGADSTLLLAKIRERDRHRAVSTTTYFHEDWRDDLNDWEYAREASTKLCSDHQLIKINNESFSKVHKELMVRARNVFHTYAAAFYAQNESVATLDKDIPIINGSGPDESIIGTEKITVGDLLSLRSLKREEWTDHLVENIEYVKIPETIVAGMLLGPSGGFVQARKVIASRLLGAPNFVEFQRRYHAITILQDHIQELTASAQALGRAILFPYLTNDIFRIMFSARFEALNAGMVYKSVVKGILEKFMPWDFVHRTKVGFQSPSRPYFKSSVGFGRELSWLLSNRRSAILNLDVVEPSIRERLKPDVDLRRRYDFLEWTAYNILLLEHLRGAND